MSFLYLYTSFQDILHFYGWVSIFRKFCSKINDEKSPDYQFFENETFVNSYAKHVLQTHLRELTIF